MIPFFSCDWGTSRFRIRRVDAAGKVSASHETSEGVQSVAATHVGTARATAFAQILENGIRTVGGAADAAHPVVISGMISSTLGWIQVPYARVPLLLDGSTLRTADLTLGPRLVRIVSGLCTAEDVMRGEETELVGLHLAGLIPKTGCTVILTGTHSKHAQVVDGRVDTFRTHPTGELYALLTRSSTLASPGATSHDPTAFTAGMDAAVAVGMGAALFRTRARTVLGLQTSDQAPSYLSGVLIGAEIASFRSSPVEQVVIAGAPDLTALYAAAFPHLFPTLPLQVLSPADCTTGVVNAHARILARQPQV